MGTEGLEPGYLTAGEVKAGMLVWDPHDEEFVLRVLEVTTGAEGAVLLTGPVVIPVGRTVAEGETVTIYNGAADDFVEQYTEADLRLAVQLAAEMFAEYGCQDIAFDLLDAACSTPPHERICAEEAD